MSVYKCPLILQKFFKIVGILCAISAKRLSHLYLLFLSNFLISLLISSFSSTEVMSLGNSSDDLAQVLGISTPAPNGISLYFFHQIIDFIIAAWCLISIHHISQSNPSLNASFSLALQRFFGALIINILLITPIIIGLSEIFSH